jgi:hypothetical protein
MLYGSANPCRFSTAKVTFLGHAGGFSLLITAYGSGRVPHVRPSVRGPKTIFFECPHGRGLLLLQRHSARNAEALEGAAPQLFRPMCAKANMGHPPREEGLLLKLNACGKLKGSGSAGTEEPACRADS